MFNRKKLEPKALVETTAVTASKQEGLHCRCVYIDEVETQDDDEEEDVEE